METSEGLISHVLQCLDCYARVHVSVSLTPLHPFSALRRAVVSFFKLKTDAKRQKSKKFLPNPCAEGEPVWSHQTQHCVTYKEF